jgi:hypothetical protein
MQGRTAKHAQIVAQKIPGALLDKIGILAGVAGRQGGTIDGERPIGRASRSAQGVKGVQIAFVIRELRRPRAPPPRAPAMVCNALRTDSISLTGIMAAPPE